MGRQVRTRGTSNTNARGGTPARRRRREWLLETFGVATRLEDRKPLVRCCDCDELLDETTLTIDRIVPGCLGGSYERGNIRPACMACNIRMGNEARAYKRRITNWVAPRHRRGCRHCASVAEYRLARHAAELQREAATCGYATETALYGPIITFRDWLIGTAAATREEEWVA